MKYLPLALLAIILGSCSTQIHENDNAGKKPNIVFILADDLGYGDLGVYGQTLIKTPNIDSLAKGGMLFTQHYAGSPVCAPSRSTLMTGQHTGHTRVRGNTPRGTLLPSDTTIAELLKQAGYKTGLIGKWGLGEAGGSGIPTKKGFDYFYGFLNQTHAHNHFPAYLWENETIDSLDNVVENVSEPYVEGVGGVAREKNTYAQDKFMEKTLNFLEQHQDSSFFLYLAVTLPHANNEARRWDRSGMEVPDLGQYSDQPWPESQKEHAAMISYLDKDVGTIMKKLKELGLEKNTLVIFTSDNGPHEEGGANPDFFDSNGQLRGLKRDLFEGGIRVPFIAHWPGKIEAGSTTDHISAFWDVMPTLCEIAGVEPPESIDGISFLPTLLKQDAQKEHDYLYWEFYEQGGKQAVRMGEWKYIKLNVDHPDSVETLLFNLKTDPGEEINLTNEQPEIAERVEVFLQEAHIYSDQYHFPFED